MTQLILTRAEPFLVSIDTKPLERAASRARDSPNGVLTEKPCRAAPKATETAPKRAPESPLRLVPESRSFRVLSGAVSPALGPALQGCSVGRCVHANLPFDVVPYTRPLGDGASHPDVPGPSLTT